jgi:hypothetical protein
MRTLTKLARSFRNLMFRDAGRSLDTCLILPKTKIVYAYIPKSACTSIKTWLLRYSGECLEFAERFTRAEKAGIKPPDAHNMMSERYLAKRWPARLVNAALQNSEFFKFTFVRHPLRRLVSAYLDKIVNAKSTGRELIASGQQLIGCGGTAAGTWWHKSQIDAERSLTFREFVQALASADPETLDVHFRAQHRLLRGLKFDFVGQLEKLPQDFAVVQRHLECSTPLEWKHITSYSAPAAGCVADWPAARFRGVAAPAWQNFFDVSLQRRCCQLYAADFEQFGYETDLTEFPERQVA